MSKKIEEIICQECDSSYKLIFQEENTSGYNKFCPFCGAEVYSEEETDDSTILEDE